MITLQKLISNKVLTSSLEDFNKDEIKYVCDLIAYKDIIHYFTKNAKHFNKIRPGFRPKSMSEKDVKRLLVSNIKNPFISTFIERKIEKWLTEIKNYYDECIKNGDSHIMAILHTLPDCIFADNIKFYFNIIEEDLTENDFELINAAITVINQYKKEDYRKFDEKKSDQLKISELEIEIKDKANTLSRYKNDLKRCKDKIVSLETEVENMEKIKSINIEREQQIKIQEDKNIELQEDNFFIQKQLSELEKEHKELETKILIEAEKREKLKLISKKVRRPLQNEMEEFKDYLGYNLEDIGVKNDKGYCSMLSKYLCDIIFMGRPIVVNHITGINIAKCISNTLSGNGEIDILEYKSNLTLESIDEFLLLSGRVICIDNFIGNYNELELIPLLEKHKDKIVFITTIYDRTLNYVSRELLRYCFYLNVNRLPALTVDTVLKEDSSLFEEEEILPNWTTMESRFSKLFDDILCELEVSSRFNFHKNLLVIDEERLINFLAFDILPYCIDVLKISPFNTSVRLLKYAIESGRCPKKNLFEEWFLK